jgi:SPX domain protein involved in polyphosphate accumulation
MKLNQEQIERLYEFTRQHYVEYYDLQTELVDHLANSIEEQWKENPKLSFETALNIEFKKFGIFGFMDVVEKRQKALSKKYYKLIWKHFIEIF